MAKRRTKAAAGSIDADLCKAAFEGAVGRRLRFEEDARLRGELLRHEGKLFAQCGGTVVELSETALLMQVKAILYLTGVETSLQTLEKVWQQMMLADDEELATPANEKWRSATRRAISADSEPQA